MDGVFEASEEFGVLNRRCRSMVLTKEDKADVARLVAVCVILQPLQACVVVLRI